MKQRQIKFRAFHTESREMLTGSLREIGQWLEEKQPIEVMQFTGLTDKNGKEIYEGDILKVKSAVSTPISIEHNGEQLTAYKPNYSNYFVVFYKGAFCIYNKTTTDNHEKTSIYNGTTYAGTLQNANYDKEIIGNIHQNPELL